MAKVRKAVIPAAGLGTRFLPATKALPKEMIPIVDKPAIQYIIEECVHSGIEDILIITGRGKRAIEDHFDRSFELNSVLQEKDKMAVLTALEEIEELEIRMLNKNKEPVFIEINATPIRKDGKIVGTQGTARDITERKQAEVTLRESEAKFKAQYRELPIPTYTWRKEGEDFVLIDYVMKIKETGETFDTTIDEEAKKEVPTAMEFALRQALDQTEDDESVIQPISHSNQKRERKELEDILDRTLKHRVRTASSSE